MHEIKAAKHPKPKQLSDPYQRYGDELKQSILRKTGRDLNTAEFTALFCGSLPAGTYEESVYYLPDVTRYLASHYWESVLADDEAFEELFKKFLMWTVFFYDELAKDGIWNDLNLFLSDLFALATERFEVRGSVPAGRDHIGYFFLYFGEKSFMQTDDPLGTCKNFPFGVTDEYMARRFEHPASYVDYAWLILLTNGLGGFTGFHGVDHVRDSAFLERVKQDKSWQSAAVTTVIAEAEARPELMDFWSACLDDAMLF
ncbi:MAG: hypothetical protein J6Y92_06095 [Lentisphaeria bacterium]|nr:hypothetical protein [Lentisphaeria bacterium]